MRLVVALVLAAWFVPLHTIIGQSREAAAGTSATSSNLPNKYWGVTADLGPAILDVEQLNTFFAPNTSASIPREGVSQTLQLSVSNAVFGYGSAYYQQALTIPDWDRSTPSLSLHQHTIGFELHKVLVDKRVKVVLPSLGMGYRFVNVTYDQDPTANLSLDSLFQRSGSFTIRTRNMILTAGAGLYYAVRGFKSAGIRQLDVGLTGSYAYTWRQGDWYLYGSSASVLVPPTRLNYYTLRFSVGLLLNR